MASPQPNREIKVQDIENGIGYWFIRVKVLRMWPQLDSSRDYAMLSLELVLMDSEGTKIQGTVPVDVFNSTGFDIAKEGYYKIGRVQVVNNDGQERATAHPFRLLFSQRSLVKPWQPRSFSDSYGLTPFTVAQIRTYKNELEHFVEQWYEAYSFVLQFTKMVPFDPASFGDCVIQIILNVTRLLFNPPIDEVFEEYDRLLSWNRFDFTIEAGRYIVLATLGSIVGNDQWWELYSECRKRGYRGHPLGYSYNDKKLLPRYNLKAQVFDGHQRLNLLLSDHNVMKVLAKFI
ncbi:Nucleic acid-binding, OB-fold [Sesbania bispinosa]|nr:Nucleic acid-binding, OB-fold [Sesbania bispinosa]